MYCVIVQKNVQLKLPQVFWILGQTVKMSGRGQVFWHPEAILSSSFSILLPCHHHGGAFFASLGWSTPLIFRPLIQNLAVYKYESHKFSLSVWKCVCILKLHQRLKDEFVTNQAPIYLTKFEFSLGFFLIHHT